MERRILVVEDIRDTLAGTLAELASAGIGIDHATNVEDAIQKLRSRKYNVVLLDWRLPVGPDAAVDDDAGNILLDRITSGGAGENSETPVIVLTAHWSVVGPGKLASYPNCREVVSKLQIDKIAMLIDRELKA